MSRSLKTIFSSTYSDRRRTEHVNSFNLTKLKKLFHYRYETHLINQIASKQKRKIIYRYRANVIIAIIVL